MTTLELLPSAATSTNGHGSVAVATREVALLGYAEDTRDLIHGMPETCETWGINMASVFLKKRTATYWFQLHPRSWAPTGKNPTGYYGRPKEHLDWLQQFDGTVWVTESAPDIPNARMYPVREIVDMVGREYFTSTFAYQLALALYEHLNEKPISTLHLFGINLTALEEYAGQRPCAEYWIGRLEQAGVRVDIPTGSALVKGATYPKRGSELEEHAITRQQTLKEKYMNGWINANTALSMQVELKHWAKWLGEMAVKHPTLFTPEVKAQSQKDFDKRYFTLEQMANQFAADMNGAMGMVKDNQHWLAMLGAADFKAPSLPLLRMPSESLINDFDLPEERTI